MAAIEKSTNKLITKLKWKDENTFVTVGINFYGEWNVQGKTIKKGETTAPKSSNVSLDV